MTFSFLRVTLAPMNAQPSEVGSVRLKNGHLAKLRAVMKARGREWFERWILKEYAKVKNENPT